MLACVPASCGAKDRRVGHGISCKEFIRTIPDFVAGELPASRDRIRRLHLDACTDCARYLESYQATVRLGREAAGSGAPTEHDAPLPEKLVDRILAGRRRVH